QLTNSKKLIIVQNAVFTNTGLTLLGTSILQINSGANMIVNANSSNLEIGSDVNSKIDIQSGANLIKNGANHFNITSLFIFNGILTINSGTINFFSSGTQTFNGNVFNNGTLNIASGGPYNFVNTLSGAGIFKVSGGIVNFNNGSSTTNEIIIENGTFNDNIGLNLNNVTVKGGVLSGPGSPVINGILNWSAGTISGSGTLTVITANFSNTLFLTTKTFKLTGVGVNLNNNSFILFLSSANFVIEQGASYTSNNSTSTSEEIRDNSITSLIINKGVITKSGSGTFTLSAPLNQETTGETDIYQGILTLNKDGGIYGAISNSATLNIQITGGLNFLGPGFNNSGTITSNALKFGASTLQELENNGTMAQLIVNNSLLSINGRQTITNAITINSGCTISEGVLDIGSLPLTGMGPSNYIKTLGAGSLRRIVPISGTNTQFPMGYGNSYNPVIIKLTSGSANQLFGVGISNELGGSDFGDEHVNRQWYIDNLSFGTITATLTLQWNAADEDPAFDRSNCFIIRREDFWETMQTNGPASTVSPGVYTRTAAELTQFSYWSIGSPGFLPVELVSFTGRTDDSKNILNWKTASEKNTSLFIVERSEDGYSNWSEVAHIKAFGNSNTEKLYSVFDENPFNESYYRLKILDFGGKYSYSKIIQIKRNNEFDSYIEKLWPNPFNNNLTLELFNKLESSEAKVQILNFQGELVYEKELESSENKQEINLDLVKLPDGPYIIQLINERIKPIQTKIIKCKSL
ncbi:MAG TPA: T9SS type A sorting domain-containing protein, partial [Saprospiraceae bacterium]|nr:T9SS type A sorting domain-containing protein [Saprospiraceae bacterium]